MVPTALYALLQCPTCRTRHLYVTEQGMHCASCGSIYPIHHGYIDMMPRDVTFGYVSKYVYEEESLAEELDYRELAPPLLAAGVRNRTMVRLLQMQPGDVVLDNGCGNGRFAVWNADRPALMVGSDPATLFADVAREHVALVKADARILPFAPNSIDKAFSIDVLEHFPRDVVDAYLRETWRVLRPGGRVLLFSNTRERSPIQPIIDVSRHIGRLLVRMGVYDFEREARRKSDHVKALETWEDVLDACTLAGFRPVRVVFWNSLCTTLVEHVLMKLGEVVFGRRKDRQCPDTCHSDHADKFPPAHEGSVGEREIRARQRVRGHLTRQGALYYILLIITYLMELDVWLFGWMRCGTYFLLVEKVLDTSDEK